MNGLRCRVSDRGGYDRTAEVLGVTTMGGAVELTVRFGPGEDVALPLADRVELALFGPDLYKPHSFEARPIRRKCPGGRETYGFKVDPARRHELELVVGGRATLRVQPKAGEEVTAELRPSGRASDTETTYTCQVWDASVSGLSLGIDWADEKRLVEVRDVAVRLFLPGATEAPASLNGRIQRRSLNEDRIVYGVALDLAEGPAENPSIRDLAAYIERRYQELSGGVRVLRRTA